MYDEIDLFSYVKPKFKITKPIRLIETFAGIGSQLKSLRNLGANVESWKCIEFDQHAIDSFNAIHNTTYAPQDITQTHAQDLEIIDRESYCYILTYSFPCQDLSLAGKQKGMTKGSGTRSGLLWEVERIIDECGDNLPHLLIMENVPQVHGTKNKEDFNKWINFLKSKGYSNYWKDLNAKDYGIPQNRNRTFMVSILGDYYYEFPKKIPLKLRLKDMLEDNVDEKYFLSDEQVSYFIKHTEEQKAKGNGFNFDPIDIERERVARTLNTNQLRTDNTFIKSCPEVITEGNYTPKKHEASRVLNEEGIAATIKENHGTINAIKRNK